MSISSISPASSLYSASASPSAAEQRRSEFKQLAQDLQSGDLSGAQSTYKLLAENYGTQQSNRNSPAAQAFQALGQALQSGNLSDAQQAFANLQQAVGSNSASTPQASVQGTHRGHHGHHHRTESDQDSSSSTTSTTSPTTNATTTPVSENTVNLLA